MSRRNSVLSGQFLHRSVDYCQDGTLVVVLLQVPGLRYTFGMNEKEEVERLLNVLRVVVRLLGLSNREIERRWA